MSTQLHGAGGKPRLLDLFCGAGGCTKGYQEAGFYVVGVDINPQPNYCGDQFIQADALELLTAYAEDRALFCGPGMTIITFDAIHASPPCQAYSVLRHTSSKRYPDLIGEVRALLLESELPYVIENVAGAPLQLPVRLCGSMFGLGSNGRQLRRHRYFETSVSASFPEMPCRHKGQAIGVYGGGPTERPDSERGGYQGTVAEKAEAMGIDWMTGAELNQAIPPAYTRHIGSQLLQHLHYEQRAAA